MKSEVTLVFEETDGTLKWLFKIISYAYHVSELPVRKMLEPMLKEFLHPQSYRKLLQLAGQEISEEELVQKYLNNGLLRFNSSQVEIRGSKIKGICFMIEQAGTMQTAADEQVPECILQLFIGHDTILEKIKYVVTEALVFAGAKGVHIDEFSSK